MPQHCLTRLGPLSVALHEAACRHSTDRMLKEELPSCLQEGGNSTAGLPGPSQPAAGAGSSGERHAQQQTPSAGLAAGEGDSAAWCVQRPPLVARCTALRSGTSYCCHGSQHTSELQSTRPVMDVLMLLRAWHDITLREWQEESKHMASKGPPPLCLAPLILYKGCMDSVQCVQSAALAGAAYTAMVCSVPCSSSQTILALAACKLCSDRS